MSNKKTYIVIKEIEGLSIGDELVELGNLYCSMTKYIWFYKKGVESDSEHFELREETIIGIFKNKLVTIFIGDNFEQYVVNEFDGNRIYLSNINTQKPEISILITGIN